MNKKLLTILHCPITHKGLALANAKTLKTVNDAIAAGRVANQEGQTLHAPLAEALLTDDGKVLYPVADGIPVLLAGESINMEQLG
jgi:uncharacterized protein YbaR (Trm112 family)